MSREAASPPESDRYEDAPHPREMLAFFGHAAAEQELLDARVTRIEAEAQRYLGVYRVLQAMGLLSVDHLKLGIPTYDPTPYFNAVRNAPAHSAQGQKLDRILEKIGR